MARETAKRQTFLQSNKEDWPQAFVVESIHLRPFYKDRRIRDRDNLSAACKPYFDGIADALRQDDSTWKPTGVSPDVDRKSPRLEIDLELEVYDG